MNKKLEFKTQKHNGNFEGTIRVASDKSITHRAFMLASICKGKSKIVNPLLAKDCENTLNAMQSLGVKADFENNNVIITGLGLNNFRPKNSEIYLGNSGTGMRLLAGLLASQQGLEICLTGDESLSKRPMDRITKPIALMGGKIIATNQKYPPLQIYGTKLKAITYELPMASAQVKSSILLAGLFANGETQIIEPEKSRDHTERMFKYLDINIKINEKTIQLQPLQNEISAREFFVPADISSASFFIALGVLASENGICVKDVGLNPTRDGILRVLKRMNADVKIENKRMVCGEEIGDIIAKKSDLKATKIEASEIPLLVDEIPIISSIALFADGDTIIKNAEELRVKESDRIKAIKNEYSKLGANITELDDGLIIHGMGNDGFAKLKNCAVNTYYDHRIAMSLIILGRILNGEMILDDVSAIGTSFNGFFDCLNAVSKIKN